MLKVTLFDRHRGFRHWIEITPELGLGSNNPGIPTVANFTVLAWREAHHHAVSGHAAGADVEGLRTARRAWAEPNPGRNAPDVCVETERLHSSTIARDGGTNGASVRENTCNLVEHALERSRSPRWN